MYHYVVVGAGSAGCALAARLSEDPSTRVLVLEAGPADDPREVAIPAAFSKLFKTELDWAYHTVPQRHLDDRVLYWPRGRMLGGSSSLNAMMWVRGVPLDYDQWGIEGWRYADLLPTFRRMEDAEREGGEHTGRGGPIVVAEQRHPSTATRIFLEAAVNAGFRPNPNPNAGDNEGVSLTQVTQRRGKRCSAATAYLRPAMRRPNLVVETGARVARVVVEGGGATGVTYLGSGEIRTARAEAEVILAGGAVNSPQLLMLSGIGPADHLRRHGIEVVADLPGVGSNLFDHLACGYIVSTTRTDSLAAAETLGQLARYLLTRKGMLTSNVGEAHAFFKSDPRLPACDLELIFAPVQFLDHGLTPPEGHGYTIGVILLQPRSSGRIGLASDDPLAPPLIDPRYLSEPEDVETLRTGMARARDVLHTSPLAEAIDRPVRPDRWPATVEELDDQIRRWSETIYHPVGTCRMGTDDLAVVGPDLRVRGVEGLRVADASVMPYPNRGHTNAPAIMIGERAADLIRG